ncbi:transglycosylase domain-containing protein [Solwaraspora sp. WMMD1047]|uniref:transglycosylase domain-containing protein n=1 Tax=Solwaraspora sp. WMMD1047 TaxID=3016102 RepID=UPI00241811E9|nr:transglycosylase domain-containing protein [Solwaraspora sp. WMMD1047]MDG4834756.1 transglycosylase domain-containing protein [Solwaraspora sp. WMMD1047]
MNSYGDPTAPRGRAQIPGAGGDAGPDEDWPANGRTAPPPRSAASGRASSGRASVGSASVGSASVGSASVGGPPGGPPPASRATWSPPPGSPAPAGAASAGRARVGRATVPGAPGVDDELDSGYQGGRRRAGGYGDRPARPGDGDRPAGRAVVGAAAVGAASVAPPGARPAGRAMVRPVSPAGPDDPWGPPGAGPGGPDGPDGPGGPGGPGGRSRRAAKGGDPEALRRAKKRKRANILIASFAVMIMLAGIGVVGFTWFYDEVKAPTEFGEPETTSITFSDGSQLAKLGDQNRTIVPNDQISPVVKRAVMAAEDKNFEKHSGIDAKGIARAAWNNFSGGTTQGASTITQQYARHVADLTGINYARKIREAVLASKLEQDLEKDEILGYYLNAIYFGRGAYGIEAAAQTYLGKSVLVPPGEKNAITPAEAAVLASVIKQPEPDPITGHKGYDPQINRPEAEIRWTYTMNNMAEMGWITAEERAAAVYPEKIKTWDPKKNCAVDCGVNKPTGNVINYVRKELEQMGLADEWKKGGYRIKTTIDKRAQAAAEGAARRAAKSSPMNKLPREYMAALVAVNPTNGHVLAYYGGENGTGTDYAGYNIETDGRITGGHPPGSTFKVYTLAAAMRAGISMDSRWDATLDEDKERDRDISNAGREGNSIQCPNNGKYCTLSTSTIQSYNVPFYWITKEIGPDKVVEAARDAGIRTMWTDKDEAVDLTQVEPSEVAPLKFDLEVGFGQYKVTVLDHAAGMATLANRGKRYDPHFIASVEKRNPTTGKYEEIDGEQLKVKEVFEPQRTDDILDTLKEIPSNSGNSLAGGRPSVGKTGTWELGDGTNNNGDAWMIGASKQIAAAVWVGRAGNRGPIKDADGTSMNGGDTPADIWEQFMEKAHEAMKLPQERFEDAKGTGDPNHPAANGVSPAPPVAPPSNNDDCDNPLGLFCPQRPDNPGGQDPNNPNNPGGPGGPGGPDGPGGDDGDGQENGGAGGGLLPSPTVRTRE